jgi:ketosteroid isomerase-like protein
LEFRSGVGQLDGREEIHDSFMEGVYSGSLASLRWNPGRAEVSATGDLGYTVGTYQRDSVDTAGTRIRVRGGYIRVWRRQPDDSWKVEATSDTPVTAPEVIEAAESGGG